MSLERSIYPFLIIVIFTYFFDIKSSVCIFSMLHVAQLGWGRDHGHFRKLMFAFKQLEENDISSQVKSKIYSLNPYT